MPTSAAPANIISRSAHDARTLTKNYLVAKGVAATRMKTISYGKERPVAICDDISCWSQEPPRRHRARRRPGSS